MSIEGTGKGKLPDAEYNAMLDARAIRNKEIEARISALSDQEFIGIPELKDPKTGKSIVTGVEYLELGYQGWTDECEQTAVRLAQAYPDNHFIGAVAAATKVFRLPFRYRDTWKNTAKGHAQRKAWRSSLPFPISDRLSKIVVTANNINALLRNPFSITEEVDPEEFIDVTFRKLASDAEDLSVALVSEYDTLDPKDKHTAAAAVVRLYVELVDWMAKRYPLPEAKSPVE